MPAKAKFRFYHALWGSERPFEPYFPDAEHVSIDDPADLRKNGAKPILVIWGGQDISPAIYNRPRIRETGAGDEIQGRDATEVALIRKAQELKIPVFGVCRGAQLVCALSGGILVQHTNGHGYNHMTTFADGKKLPYSSMHHQMMFPWKVPHKLLAWTEDISDRYLGLTAQETLLHKVEPEIVHFTETNCFGVQGHPEFMGSQHPAVAETMRLFKEHCL